MSDQLTELFRATETPEPPLPDGFAAATLARAKRHTFRRQLVPAAAAVLAVVAVVALVPLSFGRTVDVPAHRKATPSLPSEFASYSGLTATVSVSPAGRAIALYEFGSSELFTSWQTLVAGADGDTYRRVDSGDNPAPPVLLAPDGEKVLFANDDNTFTLLDLSTAATRTLQSLSVPKTYEQERTLFGWSVDGRYVAYGAIAPSAGADSLYRDLPVLELAILDLETGATTRHPEIRPVVAAAFGPDGNLAVQVAEEIRFLDVTGRVLGSRPVPPDRTLMSRVGWSPDGSRLAWTHAGEAWFHTTVTSATYPDASIRPVTMPGDLVGWRSPTSMVIFDNTEDPGALIEVSLVDGRRTRLSTFNEASNCEYWTQSCNAYRVQLATNLVPAAIVREPDPDRGPFGPPVTVVGVTLAALLVSWIVRSRVRRRAERRPPRL